MDTQSNDGTSREQWLTPAEVATEMKVSKRTAQRMCRRGDLPARKVGKAWRIHPGYKDQLPTAKSLS